MTTELTIYYDGECPLCLAEIHLLKQHNDSNLLAFIDLQSLDASTATIDCTLALEVIHATLGDETVIVGPEVFFEAYKRTNLTLMKYLFSFRFVRYCYATCYVFLQNIDTKFRGQLDQHYLK